MIKHSTLRKLAKEYGTPLFVIDHQELRRNYAEFKKYLPRVQAYFAVKSNSHPDIVKTLFRAGASFDVASMPEFMLVYQHIKHLPPRERQQWIWDKIIYANPIKSNATLTDLDQYRPLVTYDNYEEIKKIAKFAPQAGLALRIRVPNTGSMVELSSKFGASPGESVNMIEAAHKAGLVVEGLSFHVGSQCTNFQNYIQALQISAGIFKEAADRGFTLKLLDIGGGFPARYDRNVRPFAELAAALTTEIDRLFPKHIEILAEPGRFLVATACVSIAEIHGKAERDGKLCYYINDGIYGTFSGILFDHCRYPLKAFKKGPMRICSVFGPTCDALDTLSHAERLPANLELGDLVYAENIGAYSTASATTFNGMPLATIVSVHQNHE